MSDTEGAVPSADRWRTGSKNPYTVYRVGDGASDVEHARQHFLTAFRFEADARRAVDAVNAVTDLAAPTRGVPTATVREAADVLDAALPWSLWRLGGGDNELVRAARLVLDHARAVSPAPEGLAALARSWDENAAEERSTLRSPNVTAAEAVSCPSTAQAWSQAAAELRAVLAAGAPAEITAGGEGEGDWCRFCRRALGDACAPSAEGMCCSAGCAGAVDARAALFELVALKDGDRGPEYEARKPAAWAKAREVLGLPDPQAGEQFDPVSSGDAGGGTG